MHNNVVVLLSYTVASHVQIDWVLALDEELGRASRKINLEVMAGCLFTHRRFQISY
jgi:hypothetical protein